MLCVCVLYKCAFVYRQMFIIGSDKVLFSDEGTNHDNSSPPLPPLARHGNSMSHPMFLLACQFDVFFFHLLIILCTQLTQIKEQLQKPEQETRAKGVLSLSLSLSTSSPSLSSFLDTSSSNGSGEPSAERGNVCLSPGRTLFTFPFFFFFYFISLRQFSAKRIQVSLKKKKHGMDCAAESTTNKIRNTKQVGI